MTARAAASVSPAACDAVGPRQLSTLSSGRRPPVAAQVSAMTEAIERPPAGAPRLPDQHDLADEQQDQRERQHHRGDRVGLRRHARA